MSKPSSAKSQALFQRAKNVLPGGVSRNTLLRGAYPLYAQKAKGTRVTDVDGTERIDFANNMASHIHGHAFEPIVEAVSKRLQKSSAYTMATEVEIEYAEHITSRSNNFDKIRFMNSGTEAVMAGMKAARAYTGKSKIAKVEGSYHGAYDYAEVSQAPNPNNWGEIDTPNPVPLAHGTPTSVLDEMVIIPFNDAEKAIAVLEQHKDSIACVLLDPIPHRIGMVAVEEAFVKSIREWTIKNNSLLMFDEVITFRSEVGGMQQRLNVVPDLTSMGKMIGGGFPVGALAGSDEVMSVFARNDKGLLLPHSGTFSANPITMTAGLVAMQHFDEAAVLKLNALGDYARSCITDVIKQSDIPACVTGTGSLFRIHLKQRPPTNYRESHLTEAEARALSLLIDSLYDEGMMMIHTLSAALSTPTTESDIDRLCEALARSFSKIGIDWFN